VSRARNEALKMLGMPTIVESSVDFRAIRQFLWLLVPMKITRSSKSYNDIAMHKSNGSFCMDN